MATGRTKTIDNFPREDVFDIPISPTFWASPRFTGVRFIRHPDDLRGVAAPQPLKGMAQSRAHPQT